MARTPSMMPPLGTRLPAFDLLEPCTGGQLSSDDLNGTPLLVGFVCNHCPFVVHLWPALLEFAAQYAEKGLQTVAINSNDAVAYPDDSPERMVELVHASGASFPYLFDESQAAARAFDAACTPDFFLFDAAGYLVYRGQFDSARPGNGIAVSGVDMRAAVDALLAGEAINTEQMPSVGCSIKWKNPR